MDGLGEDFYSIPEDALPVKDAPPLSKYKDEEERKLMEFINTPVFDWQCEPTVRKFRQNGDLTNNLNSGRTGFQLKTPPPGYICHRCKVPGHFIQHCSTKGDPNFDVKRTRPPTGIPKSMLMATPNGSVPVLKPNEAAFEKEIEGMPSTRRFVGNIPPELLCPVCKVVMKDAVFTSKCCFRSFCDKCIRDYVIFNSGCICGAKNILADDLLPNKTLRDTINRILESSPIRGNTFQFQDIKSNNPAAKIPSPTQPVHNIDAPIHRPEAMKPDDQGQLKFVSGEAGKKNKKCKDGLVLGQQFPNENYMAWMDPNAYWGMQQSHEDPFYSGGMPSMGYGYGSMETPFGGGYIQPYVGQDCMLPFVPPQRVPPTKMVPPRRRRYNDAFEVRGPQRKTERRSGERDMSREREPRERELERERKREREQKREWEREREREFDRREASKSSSKRDISRISNSYRDEEHKHKLKRVSSSSSGHHHNSRKFEDACVRESSSKRKFADLDDNMQHRSTKMHKTIPCRSQNKTI